MEDMKVTTSGYDLRPAHAAMQRYVDGNLLSGFSSAVLVGRDLVDVKCIGWADKEARIPLGVDHIWLFLPESWTSKRARLERAGVPTEYRTARTKPEMALAEIDRIIATGVRFGCVLADAGYGMSAAFRQGLTARKLAWAVGIPRHLKVYPADVQMIRPVTPRGRPRQRIPDTLSVAAEDMLATAKWQNISWRTGTKGKLRARFAAVRYARQAGRLCNGSRKPSP